MNSYQRNIAVGGMVIITTLAVVGGMLWLRGKSIGSADAAIIFDDIGNLKEAAPVRISGAPVGRVVDIVYQGVGKVAVGIKFSQPILVGKNAKASITGVGMLGDMVITLDPGSAPARDRTDTIRGTVAPGVFDKAAGLADSAAITIGRLNKMLDAELVTDLRKTLSSSQRLMAHLADEKNGPTAQINPTMVALQRTTAQFDSALRVLDIRGLQSRLDTTMRSASGAADRLASLSGRFDSLVSKVNRGEGTIGRFMTDTTLFADLRKTMQAMTTLMNEIAKNPGKIGITVHVP